MNEELILLAHILEKPVSFVIARPNLTLEEPFKSEFQLKLKRLHLGEPLAYLLGYKAFWTHTFKVTEAVLIPRADTECLVELALTYAKESSVQSICDLGTGSGAIAISLKSELSDVAICAVDQSSEALDVARENCKAILNCLNCIDFVESSWFDRLPGSVFDLIVANPPYIAENDPHLKTSIQFEPKSALISGKEGLDDIRLIIEQAYEHLSDTGMLMLEHGFEQGYAVRKIFEKCGYPSIQTYQDLSGNDRVTVGSIYDPT